MRFPQTGMFSNNYGINLFLKTLKACTLNVTFKVLSSLRKAMWKILANTISYLMCQTNLYKMIVI